MLERLGRVADVPPGGMRAYAAGGSKVAVANVAGQLHAFDDRCTHQGCSLASGELQGTTVTCPCHGSEFDVTTGAVLEGPADEPVESYTVEVDGEDFGIRL